MVGGSGAGIIGHWFGSETRVVTEIGNNIIASIRV